MFETYGWYAAFQVVLLARTSPSTRLVDHSARPPAVVSALILLPNSQRLILYKSLLLHMDLSGRMSGHDFDEGGMHTWA